MRVTIICAMREEAARMIRHMTDATARITAGVQFTEGKLEGHDVSLCLSGVGKSNAAATTQLAVCACAPDVIINIGLAGNCTSLPLGGVVIADNLVYHDVNMDFVADTAPQLHNFTPDRALSQRAEQACAALGLPVVHGTVATGDVFVNDNAVRADIIARTGCVCVEMESAAVAHIAHKNGVRYAVVKIMSDNADDDAFGVFHESLSVDTYCEASAGIIAHMLKHLQ